MNIKVQKELLNIYDFIVECNQIACSSFCTLSQFKMQFGMPTYTISFFFSMLLWQCSCVLGSFYCRAINYNYCKIKGFDYTSREACFFIHIDTGNILVYQKNISRIMQEYEQVVWYNKQQQYTCLVFQSCSFIKSYQISNFLLQVHLMTKTNRI